MLNQQKPEPQVKGDAWVLDVHSIFYTIQGEGPFTGERALFFRLAGCNLQCPWCDTEYTDGRERAHIEELANMVTTKIARRVGDLSKIKNHLVVITGGEPFRQPIGRFVQELIHRGLRVQIETNGVLEPDRILQDLARVDAVHIVCSPKTSRIHPSMHVLAKTFKYVLHHERVADDGLPTLALGHKAAPFVARPNRDAFKGKIYVNPEDSKDPLVNAANLAAVKRSCMEHGYIAGVQLHKLLDVE